MSENELSSSRWLTPSANEDAAGTVDGKMQRMVTHQAKEVSDQLWSTPRASDGEKGGPNQVFGAGGMPLPAQTMRLASSLPVPAISPDGKPSSKERRALNPRFVAWLMGWPQPASTGFGFSATESYLYKQRMRCALSQLGSPVEAPPPQLALFE